MSAAFDVAIVGAGPAGSSAALHLARGGARVVLIEKQRLPRPKVCGGGLVARARKHLPAGIELPIERVCRTVEIRHGDLRFAVTESEPVVELAMRADLDARLAEAAARASADLRDGCEVTGIDRRDDAVVLATSRGEVRARHVIAADGVHSPLARLAGWNDALQAIPAIEAEVHVAPDTLGDRAENAVFDFGDAPSGYAWTFPKRAHLSAGVLSTERGRGGLRAELDRYLARLGLDHHACDARGWLIPTRPRAGGFTRGGVMLVGDAAGLADPVTAEGISLALWSGRLAAESMLANTGDASRAYERALAREILPELRVARALAHVLYRRPRITRALFERAGQPLARAMAEVVAGRTSYRALVRSPSNWLRLALAQPSRAAAAT
ncbi:MAG: NAD(P)/FAD-dependent oxidoreductase [Planctomycetota bacterium]|nr:NAD(P)/FAD-dependent oxidoreductase [Planctomycetota bacterium]